MATKVLGTKLEENDLQYLIGLAKDAEQRRVIRALFGYQLKMIEQLSLSGIDNCKQLHKTWLTWITHGCRPDEITSKRNHHGHKAMLQYAQRLYIRYVRDGEMIIARKWRDTVTTVLRAHQVCGPNAEQRAHMWNDSIKSNITQPLGRNELVAIIRGSLGIKSRYNEPCAAQDVYTCLSSIRSYFDMIEKIPWSKREGIYRTFSHLVPDLKTDDFSLLIKAGPHTVQGKKIPSIFGQGIDAHVLKNAKPDCFKVDPEEVSPNLDEYPERELYIIPSDKSLLDVVDDLNEMLLDSYKNSTVRHRNADKDISYEPQIPVGSIPASIEAAPGRTVLIADKAGKTRPISIATYTVNNALKPLHLGIQQILERIRQDSSHQDKGITHILEMTTKSDSFICSADLSSATDRLPVSLQAYILYRVLKLSCQKRALEIAHDWYLIMTGTPFSDPVNKDLSFRYGAGQPMGVYTSWPMLALTNHILIRAAYWRCHDKSLDYLVCGDDTVIGSKEPFLYYESWMNALGVKINRSKSHICESSDPIKVAEFCKRLAVNGEIVSSESPSVLIRAARDKAYQPGAISCIQKILGPISNAKLASLVGSRRVGNRKLALPFRYGGWGLKDARPFHEVLLEDNFIFLYIYKKMRSKVSALETRLAQTVDVDQKSIDSLSTYTKPNPYRQADKDWRLMGRKVYTPIRLCQDYLANYEEFIIGRVTLQPSEIYGLVKDTFDQLDQCLIPLKLSSKDVNYSESKLAITYQRMFTRTMRNIESAQVHTFAFGIQPISIDIDWKDDHMLSTPKELVLALDKLI
jgi:hypothetical protein